MGKDMRGKTRPRKDANTQIIDVGMCVCMCKYMYYTHGNTHTHLCTFHVPKSLSLSSPNNLLLIAFLFLLFSLRLKNCMSPPVFIAFGIQDFGSPLHSLHFLQLVPKLLPHH